VARTKQTPPAPKTDPADVPSLVVRVRTAKQDAARHEAGQVVALVRLGEALTALGAGAGRAWAGHLRDLGFRPRPAARPQALASGWWAADQDAFAAEFAPNLPPDVGRLEPLARLTPSQLRDQLGRLDCKTAPRKEIVSAVKELLGEAEDERPKADALAKLHKAIDRLLDAVDGLEDVEERRRPPLRAAFTDAARKMQAALAAAGVAPAA
jgi:hypothetical protein